MISTTDIRRERDYLKLKDKTIWPKDIWVLTDELLNDYPFTSKTNNSLTWAEKEGIHIEVIKFWWTIHEKIITYLLSRNEWRGQRTLIYNTAWAYLGYIHNQDPAAIKLSRQIKRDKSFKLTSMNLIGSI